MTGQELRDYRTRLHLSQKSLAVLCYVDPISVWRWEHGKHPIPPLVAEKVVLLMACLPRAVVSR